MGVVRKFLVELNSSGHPNGVYYTGQVITGNIQLDLKEEMKMRGIRLYFSGEGNVKWAKRTSDDNKLAVKSSEKYVEQTIVIYGKAPGDRGKNSVHPAGQFRYPFQVLIPENIPSSFRGKYGSIVYKMRAVIDRPWNFDETSHPVLLTIHRFVDLNREPNAHIPQQAQGSLPLHFLCCLSGSVQVTCTTSKTGYTPGEPIVIHGQVINQTGSRIKSISAILRKNVTYHCRQKSKIHSEVIVETKVSPVPEADKDFWAGSLQLQLPLTVPPFRLDHSNLIDLRYILWVTVSMSWRRKIKLQLEIAVGSVPFNGPENTRASWMGHSGANYTATLPSSWTSGNQASCSPSGHNVTRSTSLGQKHRPVPSAPPPPYSLS